MKKFCLTTTVAVFLLIFSNGIQAQTVTNNLDQLKLMQQYLGTWQANAGKDTVEVWDFQQYGKAFIINVSQVIKGQNTPLYINNIAYDSKEGKFKGFALMNNGSYGTWTGLFTSEKKFEGNDVVDFNPATAYVKLENIFKNPKEWTFTNFNTDGVKTLEMKFVKIK